MKKKAILLAVFITLSNTIFQGCNSKEQTTSSDDDQVYTYELNMYVDGVNEYPNEESEFDKFVREKFKIAFKYDRIPRSNWEQKTNLLFASGNEPEITTGGKETNYKQWASKGYLRDIDVNNGSLENYKNLWSKDEWDIIYEMATSADGKLYYLPSVRAEKVQMTWVYRKDIFDELGLRFPETIDQLYTVLKKLKEKYPDKVILSGGSNSGMSALTGFFQAYWMPELLLRDHSYVDPVTQEFVPYGFATENARKMFITLNKFYKEGLIDQEILSLTKQQLEERITNGKTLIMYDYAHNVQTHNLKTRVVEPNANWEWARNMITAYPEKGVIFKRDPYYSDWGPAFTTKLTDKKFERILKYYDWTATEEGQLFTSFGIEGLTYDMIDGKPVFKDHMYDAVKNPEGKKIQNYGIMSSFTKHPESIPVERRNTLKEVEETFFDRPQYYFFSPIPFKFTEEEDKKRVDLELAVNDIRDQYFAKFLMNVLDPADDAAWNEYINALKKVGLDELNKIRTDCYNRIQKQN